MQSATHPPFVRTRLSMMMFLEFFIWGGWYVAVSVYSGKVLHFSDPEVGALMSTTAIGAILAPLFVGYVADRLFATERILALLHLLGGVCLIVAAQQTTYRSMHTLLLLNGLFFMPTMALANSLAFRHIPDPTKFPRVAVLGTIGWIVSNLALALALGGAEKNTFFYLSGGAGIVMALYCLTLPHTPPKGGVAGDVFGLGAIKLLLRDPSFFVFTVCAFLVVMPATAFFVATPPMLQELGFPAPMALMTLNQVSEILFMFTMPLFVTWLGLKRVLTLGMLAWALRYACFASGSFSLVIVGLLLHGLCYSFVFVGAYMFVDRRAPVEIKASAQSLISFLMLGVGWWIGCNLTGEVLKRYPAPVALTVPAVEVTAVEVTTRPEGKKIDAPLPRWDDPAAATSVWSYLDLSGTINRLRTGKTEPPPPDLSQSLDADRDGAITRAELVNAEDKGLILGNVFYDRAELIKVFEKIADVKSGADFRVTRGQWIAAQAHQWQQFWRLPAAAALAICLLFALAYREKREE